MRTRKKEAAAAMERRRSNRKKNKVKEAVMRCYVRMKTKRKGVAVIGVLISEM